ncbi:MAG TPA: D-isomer specific 2-hydroxyacid dehydrogenase family protein [Aggregatilineales bacterium]|nr:D-isomer specific 2-hydroxyacid dehydrogenase family protein [Aggregatilineales bacterium]
MPKVLFLTDRAERHQRAALKYAPPDLEVTLKRRPAKADLMPLLPSADFIISERNIPITGEMISAAENLKLIVRLGSLTHDIDRDAARAIGVRVSAQPVIETIYVAEHLLMMILATRRHLGRSFAAANAADHGHPARRTDDNTFSFNWCGFTDLTGLYGKQVAIVGMGESGVELARRLRPFRLDGLYYNKQEQYPRAVERELGITYRTLPAAMTADVVVSLLPYNAQTHRVINAEMLGTMKHSAVLVHAGSGGVIDEQALVEALKAGTLAGAALDTYEFEPLQPTHSLVKLARDPESNLLLTPHTAGATPPEGPAEDYGEIMRFLKDEPLRYEIS